MSSKWGVAPVLSILSLLIGTWSTVYPSLLIMLKFYPNKRPIIDSLTWTLIEILQVVQIEYYSSFQKKKEKRKREKSITVALWNLFIVIQPQVMMCHVSHVLQYISFRNIPNEEDLLILFWLLYIISHFSVAYTKISNSRDLAIYMVWDTLQFYDIFDLQRIVRNYKMFRMLTEIDVCLLNCRLEKQFLKVFPGMMSHGSFLPLFPSLVDLPSEFPICLCNQWFAFSLNFFCSTTLPFH